MRKIISLTLFFIFVNSFLFSYTDYKRRMKLNKPFHYYKVLGDRYRILKKYSKAIKKYEYALALNPDCAECYLYLGEIKYKRKISIEIIKELKIAVTKKFRYSFDRVKAYFLLATIYFEINREGKGIEVLKYITTEYNTLINRAIESRLIDSNHYAPAFFLIGLYFRNNNFLSDKNISYFKKSMELNYKKDFCNYFLYEYYKSKNRPDEAFRFLNQAMIVNGNIQNDLQQAAWIKNYKIIDEIE